MELQLSGLDYEAMDGALRKVGGALQKVEGILWIVGGATNKWAGYIK